jgi:putative salt-induced outer membrane protein
MMMKRYTITSSLAVSAVLLGTLGATPVLRAQDAAAPEKAAPVAEPAKKKEPSKWKQTAGLGFTLTGGNSDTLLFTADYAAGKKWADNEFAIGAAGGYGENDGTVNNNFLSGFAQYNRLFGPKKRWFGFGRAEGNHDEIADIAYRVPLNVGLGYYFLKQGVNGNEKFNLAAEVGPGYAWEKVGGITDSYATIVIAERFSYQISEKTRLWQSANYTPSLENFDNYTVNAEVGVETQLVGNLSIRSVFSNSYRSQPAAGRDSNDYKFITSLAYNF